MRDSPGRARNRSRSRERYRSPDESSRSYDNRRQQRDGRSGRNEYDQKSERRRYSRDRRDDASTHYRRRRSQSPSHSPIRRSRALPSQDEIYRRDADVPDEEKPPPKEKPNYKPTGFLAKEANTVAGTTTVLKYHEPPEGRKPSPRQQWRMYVFKGKDLVDTVYLFQRSCWLVGRDQKVTDLYLEHSSISKQHAVIQFRFSSTTNEYGDKIEKVKPYLIDLESANGTKINDKRIEASRYVELVDGDVITFANSEREYVMMLPAPDKK